MAAYIYTFHPLTIILSVTWSSLYLSLHIKHVCIYLSLFRLSFSLFPSLFFPFFFLVVADMHESQRTISLSLSFLFLFILFSLIFPFSFFSFLLPLCPGNHELNFLNQKKSERHQSPTVEEKEWHWGAHLGRRGCPAHIDMCLVHLNGAWYDSSLQN